MKFIISSINIVPFFCHRWNVVDSDSLVDSNLNIQIKYSLPGNVILIVCHNVNHLTFQIRTLTKIRNFFINIK